MILLTLIWSPIFSHRFALHSDTQALLKPTILTLISSELVNHTRLIFAAFVLQVFLNGTFEEAFASLATVHTIVVATAVIATYSTRAERFKSVQVYRVQASSRAAHQLIGRYYYSATVRFWIWLIHDISRLDRKISS